VTTVLTTGYNVAQTPTVVQALQRLYFVNDFDAMKVTDDGLSLRAVGITSPASALSAPTQTSGNCSVGVHLVRYRYEDSRRQRLSEPSAAISVTVSSSAKQLAFTNITSSDTTVDKITFEMTAAGASTYYRVATVTNAAGTTNISTVDTDLINLTPASIYGEFGHQPPPLNSIMAEHRQRLFLWGSTIRTFTVSVTTGSATVTGTGFSTQWAGRKATFSNDTANTYYVSSATTTSITLTGTFSGATNASVTMTIQHATPDLLGWSRAGYPESWDTVNQARRITLNAGDTPAAMASVLGDLYLIGQRSMRRLVYTSDPGQGMLVAIPNSLGAFHPRCVVVDAGGMCFGWGRDGVWLIDAMQPKKISDRVDTTISTLADPANTSARFLVYEPVQRQLACFFPLVGETSCRAAVVYDINSGRWSLWYFRQGMTAGCLNSAYTDRVRLMLADTNGFSWRMGTAANDGGGAGVVLATSGSTTTTTNCSCSATTGQMIYRPATAETALISAVGGSSVTHSAFATACTAGEAIWIGSFRQRIVTDWVTSEGMKDKKRPSYLLINVRPNTNMGTMDVYIYLDFSSNPTSFSALASDNFPTGVTLGTNKMTVNLDTAVTDGFVAIPLVADWNRAIRAEIQAQTPYDGLRILGITFSNDPHIEAEVLGE
jgi:hypothetical protein